MVHPAKTLFIDENGDIYWTFVFHPDIIYYQSKDDEWLIFQGEIKDLLDCLDEKDEAQNQLYNQMNYQFQQGIIENAKPEIQKDISCYLDQIFDYETFLKLKKERGKSRKEVKTELEKKYEQLQEMIEIQYIPNRITPHFIQELIFFMDRELDSYLRLKEAFWIDPRERPQFEKEVRQMESHQQFKEFLSKYEKSLSQAFVKHEPQEEEEVFSSEEKDEKKMHIEPEDNDEDEIQIKRRNKIEDVLNDAEEEDASLQKKKVNLKFWNFYF